MATATVRLLRWQILIVDVCGHMQTGAGVVATVRLMHRDAAHMRDELAGACSPRTADREVAACLARKLQRAKAGDTQILVQHADHTAADDIAWAHHGVRRNRHAAGERLELNDPESAGPARKYEHVRRCHQT